MARQPKLNANLIDDCKPDLCRLARTQETYKTYFACYRSVESVKDRMQKNADDEDDRNIVDLLTDQLEFADVVIINKVRACVCMCVCL